MRYRVNMVDGFEVTQDDNGVVVSVTKASDGERRDPRSERVAHFEGSDAQRRLSKSSEPVQWKDYWPTTDHIVKSMRALQAKVAALEARIDREPI